MKKKEEQIEDKLKIQHMFLTFKMFKTTFASVENL